MKINYIRHSTLALTPIQCAVAYNFQKGKPKIPVKIGIGSLGGNISQADLQKAATSWGINIPAINVITLDGKPPISDPGGANVENMLDIEIIASVWFHCTGTPVDLTICIGPNDTNGIANVTQKLVDIGCKVINWSWGGPESQWSSQERQLTESVFTAAVNKGVTICAASGDNSINDGSQKPNVDYPCGSIHVWSVGGTKLIINQNGSIKQELAWGDGKPGDEGGGGGFDSRSPKPSWQSQIPGKIRGCPDSAANADPNSGYLILADGQWQTVGGTSGASPLTAAYIAVCKALTGAHFGNFGPVAYKNHNQMFNDIIIGSNGDPASKGWDPATGNGSPNGPQFLNSLTLK